MLDDVARLDHMNPCHDDYGNPIRSVSHVDCYCDGRDSPYMDSDVRPCCCASGIMTLCYRCDDDDDDDDDGDWTGVRDVLVVVNIRLMMMMMMMMMRMMRMVVPPRP